MNYLIKVKIVLLVLLSVAGTVRAQRTVKGIVLDSMSLTAMTGVSIKLKNSTRGTVTDATGVFTLTANDYDTLVFTYVGYVREVRAIYPEDEVMMVRLKQDVVILKEITVLGKSLRVNQDPSLKLKSTGAVPWYGAMPSSSGAGANVNLDYFSKREKEKRKLSKVLAEQDRAKAYVEIVNNPELKEEFMQRFAIDENRYYAILAEFNQLHKDVMYSSNPGIILNALVDFFRTATEGNR